jgi:hypothetical protein
LTEIFSRTVAKLFRTRVIKGEGVSLDCSIVWAWFKDCRFVKRHRQAPFTAKALLEATNNKESDGHMVSVRRRSLTYLHSPQ